LLDAGIDINSRDSSSGKTDLIESVIYKKTEVVRLLVSRKADLNITAVYNNYTALMWACAAGNPEIAKILVTGGADVDILSDSGKTALSIDTANGQSEIIKFLISGEAKQ
jgi:ankyrin repeat protein